MKPFVGIVHQDGESAYGITFPDAPGCFSAADTLDDVFIQAQAALALWLETAVIETTPPPQPRDLSILKSDPAWAESFADAVLLIAVAAPAFDLSSAA